MTEYTADPEAIAHYLAARTRTANWVDSLSGKTLVAPSAAPSLVSDTDDGLSSQDSDAESSHSLPPRMVLRYPDGRPDVAVSPPGNPQWPSQSQKHSVPSPTYPSRSQPGSHGHHPSNPNMHTRTLSNAVPLYVTPPPPVIATHPETIHIRPSPTKHGTQQGPNAYFTPPDPHNSSSTPPPSRSKRSSRHRPAPLQMIYAPPPGQSLQSHSAPVSPTGDSEGFQPAQQPPPVPQLVPPIIAPSPVYGFPSPNSTQEPPQAAPAMNSRTHSRTHSYSSNHSYPHPPAPPPPNHGPPSSYPSGSAQRPRRHSSRAASSHPDPPQLPHIDLNSSSHIGPSSFKNSTVPRRHGPPPIVYAPSVNSSSYAYNPPIITSHPPPASMTIHAPTPHHAYAHKITQSISDPTPIGGSLGRSSSNRGRLFENFSRTPSPTTARARIKGLTKREKLRKDKSRRKKRDDDGADNDDNASFSSGSTYYVLPSPGQKIKVVPPQSMNGLYAEPTSPSASKSTPALQSHRSANGPYLPTEPPPQPARPQKRPFLQRIFHPQFGHSSNSSTTQSSLSSRGPFRR